MSTLILAAAEHTSKGPFYVAGGLLACWAVLVGALGVARPAFAEQQSTGRVVMAISVVLALGAMASAVLTA